MLYENNVNQEIKNAVLYYIDKYLNKKLLNHKIKIDNLKIRNFNNDDLVEIINNFYKQTENDSYKFFVSETILNFVPNEDSNNINDKNNKIYLRYKDIRIIYSIIINNKIKCEKLETKSDLVWSNVSNFIIEEIQKMLNDLKIKVSKFEDNEGNIIKLKKIEIENPYTSLKYYLRKDIYIIIKLLNLVFNIIKN